MKKSAFTITIVLLSLKLMAHNPQVSNISIIQDSATKKCSLLITVPLLTCENELHTSYPSIQIDSLSKNQFQQLLLNHFKKNIQFVANNNYTLVLNNGLISIGHETQLIFTLSGLPQPLQTLHLNYAALRSQYDHFAVLQISLADNTTGNFIFNNENNYTFSLINKNNKWVLADNQSAMFKPAYLIAILAGAMLAIAGFIFFIRRKKTAVSPSFNLNSKYENKN